MGVCIRLFLDSSYISAGPPKLDRAHSGVFCLQLFCRDHHLFQRSCQPARLPGRIQPVPDPFPPGTVGGKAHRRADLLSGGHRHQLYDAGHRHTFVLRNHQSAQRSFRLDTEVMLLSTAIHTATLLARLLFWTGAWLFLKKYLRDTTYTLTNPYVAHRGHADARLRRLHIYNHLFYAGANHHRLPDMRRLHFLKLRCIYLASYMCGAMQTAWHAQELEMRQNYYEEKMEDETRIRQIYHDMKTTCWCWKM